MLPRRSRALQSYSIWLPGAQCLLDMQTSPGSFPRLGHERGGNMREKAAALVASVLVLCALACGGGGGGGSDDIISPPNSNVTGTWDALMTVTGGSQLPAGIQFTATFTLAQSGTAVSGTFATEEGLSGSISGSVSGSVITFTITQGSPCPGTFDGAGTISSSSDAIAGSYSGSDCNGTLQATFTAIKR